MERRHLGKLAFLSVVAGYLAVAVTGCATDLMNSPDSGEVQTRTAQVGNEMQRMVFHSRPELKQSFLAANGKNISLTRSNGQELSENGSPFVSYYDRRKAEYKTLLAPEQQEAFEKNPEGINFLFDDPIVNDARLARLLNADAEIQMGDTVYRYCREGVAYAMASASDELQKLDSLVAAHPEVASASTPVALGDALTFIPIVRTMNGERSGSGNNRGQIPGVNNDNKDENDPTIGDDDRGPEPPDPNAPVDYDPTGPNWGEGGFIPIVPSYKQEERNRGEYTLDGLKLKDSKGNTDYHLTGTQVESKTVAWDSTQWGKSSQVGVGAIHEVVVTKNFTEPVNAILWLSYVHC